MSKLTKITVREVAQRAGVSLGSVSNFLNGGRLREANRLAIETAITELGFKQNFIAKGLKRGRTMTVGVVIAEMTDIFATSIVSAIERALQPHNYSLILCDCGSDPARQARRIGFLRDRLVDGLVLFPFGPKPGAGLRELTRAGLPTVLLNCPVKGVRLDAVLIDNTGASREAVEQLIALGHREIAIINGIEGDPVSGERFQGYLDALAAHRIPVRQGLVECGQFTNAGGYHAARRLLTGARRPSALFLTNYYMTLGAMMAIHELRVRVPEDLSVIGFDRFELSDVIAPCLSVVEQPAEQMGRLAAHLLLRRMQGDIDDFPRQDRLPARLLMRESTSPRTRSEGHQ